MMIEIHDSMLAAKKPYNNKDTILILGYNLYLLHSYISIHVRVETGSGHPGQPGHVFAGSSGSDPLYKISGSDPDWITCDINGIWR